MAVHAREVAVVPVTSDLPHSITTRMSREVPAFVDIEGEVLVPSFRRCLYGQSGQCLLHSDESVCKAAAASWTSQTHANARHVTGVIFSLVQFYGGSLQGKTCIDIGAGVGEYSLLMRAAGCNVKAYEPQADLLWFSQCAAVANGWWDGIVFNNVGVNLSGEALTLFNRWRPDGSFLPPSETIVPALGISDVIAAAALSNTELTLVKINVDGQEGCILQGLAAVVNRGVSVETIILTVDLPRLKNLKTDIAKMMEHFHVFYENGYHVFLCMASEFQHYDPKVLKNLRNVKEFVFFEEMYWVPANGLQKVLDMARGAARHLLVTKNKNIIDGSFER